MAKPGDPFETDELDALRVRQRRLLRSADAWLMAAARERLQAQRPVITASAELESHLRTEVENLCDPDLEALMKATGKKEEARGVHDVLANSTNRQAGSKPSTLDQLRHRLSNESSELDRRDNDTADQLIALVVLLLLADEAATDGWRDPRAPGGEPSVH